MKYLGQNFLINSEKIQKIITALDGKKEKIIIEIGAGHGELTFLLAKKFSQVIAVEKDKELAQALQEKSLGKNIKVINGDILKILPKLALENDNYYLVGNIPYYISGYLLRTISEIKNKPQKIILTVQKEVAQRITSKAPKMNLLAASVLIWANVKIIDYLRPSDFSPRPKVESAIIEIKPLKNQLSQEDLKNYYQFIKILFKQPRKTILNNLFKSVNLPKEKIIETFHISMFDRAQNLKLQDIKKMATIWKKVAKNPLIR